MSSEHSMSESEPESVFDDCYGSPDVKQQI